MSTKSMHSQQYTFESPRRQDFSLPGSFMQYFNRNWSGVVYEKLIKTCKYFFACHQIIPMEILGSKNNPRCNYYIWNYDSLDHQLSNGKVNINLKESKLWVYDRVIHWDRMIIKFPPPFWESLYRCTTSHLSFCRQEMEVGLLAKISKNVKKFEIDSLTILNPDKSETSLWDILTLMPKLKKCSIYTELKKFSPLPGKTSTLPILPNLRGFEFFGLPEDDFPLFSEFIKLHPNTYFNIALETTHHNPDLEELKAILEELFPTASIKQRKSRFQKGFVLTLENRLIFISIY